MDLEEYSEEELLQAGREAIKREQWPQAKTVLAAYVARYASRGDTVPASGLANYALSLGHSKELRRGLELCKKAQHADPRNAHIYWCLAQLHLLAHSRKDAIEIADRGLRAVPDSFVLLRLRRRLGLRQSPPIPFLDRKHGLNVRLGRLMHRIKGSPPAVLPP